MCIANARVVPTPLFGSFQSRKQHHLQNLYACLVSSPHLVVTWLDVARHLFVSVTEKMRLACPRANSFMVAYLKPETLAVIKQYQAPLLKVLLHASLCCNGLLRWIGSHGVYPTTVIRRCLWNHGVDLLFYTNRWRIKPSACAVYVLACEDFVVLMVVPLQCFWFWAIERGASAMGLHRAGGVTMTYNDFLSMMTVRVPQLLWLSLRVISVSVTMVGCENLSFVQKFHLIHSSVQSLQEYLVTLNVSGIRRWLWYVVPIRTVSR